ncbi:SOS response-associated peptidase family protein [Stenotrophomonas sp. PS02300]|uniref:SOS response-associated peptidase family protein n=1 Tax=Stenotrophomonas sp. PS02300 TaxID=2991426 RepID=UPI00249C1DE9|nr:SOS response-associated peptidase family protein [Stenotrophomonas sp. PS02300]
MCYSAEVWADYHKYVRAYGADIDIDAFVELYLRRAADPKIKIPKGMDQGFLHPQTPGVTEIQALIQSYNATFVQNSEQELFKQAKRLADAERVLAGSKPTKKAANDQRIAGKKVKQLKRWISDGIRTVPVPERDDRIFPDWYAPVLIVEDGRPIVRPMRYHCRPAGMDPSIDRTKRGQVSGTYNARRDNLTRFWRHQFGHTHGLMVARVFYENVDDGAGGSQELQFIPSTGENLLIACLVSHWTDPAGLLPDLWSYAAVTDAPEPEVAAAGHDRTIVNLKPENVDAWLTPQGRSVEELLALMDDKQHPYYEHRKAA